MHKSPPEMFRFRLHIILKAMIPAAILLFSCSPVMEPPAAGDIRALGMELDMNRQTPGNLMKSQVLSGQDLILVQDTEFRADTIRAVESLLPSLYDGGVRRWGVFFLDEADTDGIRSFLNGNTGGMNADELLFSADASRGYLEYRQFLELVRDFNAALAEDETPIELYGLSENGRVTNQAVNGVLAGNAAGPRFIWITDSDAPLIPESGDASLAVWVHHGPQEGVIPYRGLIEKVTESRDIRDRTFAFSVKASPFDSWDSTGRPEYAGFVMVTAFDYAAVTPIRQFITAENTEQARAGFPDIRITQPRFLVTSMMNRRIKKDARRYQRTLKY